MSENLMEEKQREIVKNGFVLLKKKKNYKQTNIVNKLIVLGFETSPSAFNKIIKDKNAGSDSLLNNSRGIKKLIYQELGFNFNGTEVVEKVEEGWSETIVPEKPAKLTEKGVPVRDKGRLVITDKVALFSTAEQVIYEVGVTLNTFTNNFFHRSGSEFKEPFRKLLERGVTVKCYLLDPDSSEALAYFNDRARAKGFEEEKNKPYQTKQNLKKLKAIYDEFAEMEYRGKFELYLYRHFPTNNFLAIDPEQSKGEMTISHYLYAQLRAHNPVVKINRHDNPTLFETYWHSLQQMIKDSKPVDFEKYTKVG